MRLGNSEWMRGDKVIVERGKKVPVGTEGEAFWIGDSSFGRKRCGFKTAAGETVWIDCCNVFNVSLNERREAEAAAAAKKRAAVEAATKLAETRYGEKEYVKGTSGGWTDDSTVKMKLHAPHPVWKGGYALRWRSAVYVTKIDREEGYVWIVDVTSLAD